MGLAGSSSITLTHIRNWLSHVEKARKTNYPAVRDAELVNALYRRKRARVELQVIFTGAKYVLWPYTIKYILFSNIMSLCQD